jgi:hypothetical protein
MYARNGNARLKTNSTGRSPVEHTPASSNPTKKWRLHTKQKQTQSTENDFEAFFVDRFSRYGHKTEEEKRGGGSRGSNGAGAFRVCFFR